MLRKYTDYYCISSSEHHRTENVTGAVISPVCDARICQDNNYYLFSRSEPCGIDISTVLGISEHNVTRIRLASNYCFIFQRKTRINRKSGLAKYAQLAIIVLFSRYEAFIESTFRYHRSFHKRVMLECDCFANAPNTILFSRSKSDRIDLSTPS